MQIGDGQLEISDPINELVGLFKESNLDDELIDTILSEPYGWILMPVDIIDIGKTNIRFPEFVILDASVILELYPRIQTQQNSNKAKSFLEMSIKINQF